MSKRYVFWRSLGKKRPGKDHRQHGPRHLLAKLGTSARIKSPTEVTWAGFGVLRFQTALKYSLLVRDPDGEELNEYDSASIVQNAMIGLMTKAGGGKPMAPADVIAEGDAVAAKHFRTKKESYVAVTSISLESLPWKKLKVKQCILRPLNERGSKYPLPAAVANLDERFEAHLKSSRYCLLRIDTSGRTIYEANDNAATAVNFLRGIWNLMLTFQSWSISRGHTRQQPMGVIHPGPIISLHRPDGTPVSDILWVEKSFGGEAEPFKPKKGWLEIEKQRRFLMRCVERLPYRREMESIMARYAVALDHTDLDVAFLQLWSILEKITGTIGSNYDDTIRRTTWGWPGRYTEMEVLQALRLRRNHYVHSAATMENQDQMTYMLKSFVDPHLLRLIRNDFRVKNLDEYAQYLHLSSDVSALDKKRKTYGHAIRTLKKWQAVAAASPQEDDLPASVQLVMGS